MLLKKSRNHNQIIFWCRSILYKLSSLRVSYKILLYLLLFIVYSAGVVMTGVFARKLAIKYHAKYELQEIANRIAKIYVDPFGMVHRYLKGITATPERILIDINFENYKKLEYKRESALEKGILISNANDYVPAKIRYKNKTIRIKLRLKGDVLDHFHGDKWSFRVKIKGDETLFGMKIFSLQHPKTRDYIHEWIFHQALKREGLISLRYEFVEVILNGDNMGIYALEENFDKRLLENNKLKEGPIIKFSEDMLWNNYLHYGTHADSYYPYSTAHLDTFQTNKVNENPILKMDSIKAISLLEAYRRNKLKISDVFDIDKFSKFLAISTLLGAYHGLSHRNIRFYYNPITSKIEPIGHDAGSVGPLSFGFLYSEPFIRKMTKDYQLYEKYFQQLTRMSHPSYMSSLQNDIEDKFNRNMNIIYSEFPWEPGFPEVYYQNHKTLQKVLNPIKALHAYQRAVTKKYIDIDIGNLQSIPLEIVDVSYLGDIILRPNQKTIIRGYLDQNNEITELDPRIFVDGHFDVGPIKIQTIRLYFPQRFYFVKYEEF